MAPVIARLRACGWARCIVVATAQHRDLLDQMLARLAITIDHDLDLMTEGQTPAELLARMLPKLDNLLRHEKAHAVLAQGDTTTVLGAALAAFHCQLPFGHVEAGLRTHDLAHPFPEEGYRQMVARISRWHFAPTLQAAANLRAEGIADHYIHVTGNTGIDTLMHTATTMPDAATRDRRMVLLTAHRRENFGAPLERILKAVRRLVEAHPDIEVVFPVHPNPNVKQVAEHILAGLDRVRLIPPQDYFDFVSLMRASTLILTDSGGVQEEAPALAKPVLVLRDSTERPEAVAIGAARLVGTDENTLFSAAQTLLGDADAYARMAQGVSPYGDGHAAERIVDILHDTLRPADDHARK